MHTEISKKIFEVTPAGFDTLALEIFQFQYLQNAFYREYCKSISVDATTVTTLQQVPFLPIQFFKTRDIKTTSFDPEIIFESSGTTGSVNSKHLVRHTRLYEESFTKTFELFYGDVTQYCVLGLLPSYLERQHASLVWMVKAMIEKSGHPDSGFYLYDHEKLKQTLLQNEIAGQPTLLIGVTYALLDFFDMHPMKLTHTVVMETGGMKGRKEEMTRAAVHRQLMQQTGLAVIHSEYGMTELLSQAYAKRAGIFNCPPWMKVVVRAEDDPFEINLAEHTNNVFITGVMNIIDLANLYSCSFIATDDMGKLFKDGSFEVLGRLDNSDARGCSLMLL